MPVDFPAGARDLISRMLTVNPKRRITVSISSPIPPACSDKGGKGARARASPYHIISFLRDADHN